MKVLKSLEDDKVDFSIFGLGYESRAKYFFENCGDKGQSIAIGYTYNNDLESYKVNREAFSVGNVKIFEVEDSEITSVLSETFAHVSRKPVSVLVDITSMSRYRVTCVLWYLLGNLPKGSTFRVVYSQSKYVAPPDSSPPVRYIGPSIDDLSGRLGDLDMPTVCVISLGYEENKALGAINSIDPAEVWTLIPESQEPEFESKVLENNESLLRVVSGTHRLRVNIHDPVVLFRDIRSLLQGCMRSQRPIMIPLGPKVFAAISVLLAFDFFPNLPVWRVSSYEKEPPIDRVANGNIIEFSVVI